MSALDAATLKIGADNSRLLGLIRGAMSNALSLMVSPAGVFGLFGALLLGNCATFTPTDAAVRTADQFYDALSRGDLEAAVRMCSPKMLEKRQPNAVLNQLKQRQDKLGAPVARSQASVFMAEFHGSGVRHGTLTKFQFACEYRNARTHEELRVFEPSDGGNPEIDDYRIEMLSANGTPAANTDQK